jgi:hypothetical protein
MVRINGRERCDPTVDTVSEKQHQWLCASDRGFQKNLKYCIIFRNMDSVAREHWASILALLFSVVRT